MLPAALPWRCLVCCMGHTNPGESFAEQIRRRIIGGLMGLRPDGEVAQGLPHVQEQLPPDVRFVLEDGVVRDKTRDPDLAGVMVVSDELSNDHGL